MSRTIGTTAQPGLFKQFPGKLSDMEVEDKDASVDPRIVQTKRNLATALEKLVHLHDPNKITISALCKEAGVSRPTFYQHYSSIFDLYGETIAARLATAAPEIFGSFHIADNPLRAVSTIVSYVDDHRDSIVALLDTNMMRFSAGKLMRGWLDERLARVFYQVKVPELSTDQADRITFATNGILGLMFKRLRQSEAQSTPDELGTRLITLVRTALGAKPSNQESADR